ncbi:MAG: asparaginase/glutaminase, L-asparaginase [Candidatus Peregrinibacteria bacterium GW2011_GWF2_33_10]|nr:MAG: asparaginase/glutaminase, L-asparaginase [Candidatus Peregrinibacteria bacterium GW2011_GWF2_33_10]OGJ44338.1 MAG: hypothetical protein A2272_05695 [Candidatus Peregrinibacteria bacterium RIFOXYA12_FULL_33_12]OGJ44466.1 MAG: hypothetical protein A2263_00285 [Candidatus Peregrinibacteria bacterium RIFOXYA2_FULL_33_21]OGJ50216.1 MAG: hypothetical protein A2307_06540 [Candidatus Peregrinibacteria bacterium RIFOXYB2_FULL_33_20]
MNEIKTEPFDIQEFASQVKDPSILDYAGLKASFNKENFEALKERLKANYDPKKTNILVIGTGGTFQSKETDHGRAPEGSLEESFKAMNLPYSPDNIKINLFELFNYDSSLLNHDHRRFLAEVLVELLDDCEDFVDGFIITHGTDTMTITADYLSLILGRGLKKPVILTGSQDPARQAKTDAVYHMDNCLKVHEFLKEHGVAEVMVLCGNELVRGAWAKKISDKDSDAFSSFNDKPLLMVGNKLVKEWRLANFVLKADPTIPFLPFTEIGQDADIPVTELSDISAKELARIVKDNRISIWQLLGSATCPNTHARILKEASRRGKLILLMSPFHDSQLVPGTYAAGSVLKGSKIPQLKGTASFVRAKANFVIHEINGKFINEEGLGEVAESSSKRRFYNAMAQDLVGERF